jgi:hypothetical protein
MIYLIIAGLIALIFGVLMFFSIGFCDKPCEVCDRILFVLDEKLNPYRFVVGLVLLVIGGWLLYLVMQMPQLIQLHPFWVIAIVFGLLFLIFPHWLVNLSKAADRTIFSTDEKVRKSCKIIGILLILAALYIFYGAYSMR